MRVGIDARPMQVPAYRKRGIGQHLRNWIEAAQKLPHPFEMVLLVDPHLSSPEVNLISPQWKISPLTLPFIHQTDDFFPLHNDADQEFIFDSAVEAFLVDQGIDLFHETYSFMWEANIIRRLHRTRLVTTIYDLIPLKYRAEYLDPLGERGYQSFAQRLGATVYSQRIQTISAASMQDIIDATGMPSTHIDLISCGVGPTFAPLDKDEIRIRLTELNISGPYLFSVTGFHHTKNLRRQLEAYSLLPAQLKQRFRYVLVCPLGQAARDEVETWLHLLGIQQRVIFLQDITQPQLVALYNRATTVLHGSLCEGFGLPIVEAMRCGTPVVAANLSSMPEAAGDAAILVDPLNPQAMADGIMRMLSDDQIQAQSRERGLKHADQFTWERTAQAVLNSYSASLNQPLADHQHIFPGVNLQSRNRRPRLAFWSPLNPKPSGVSDYSEMLLAELGKDADVDVFVDSYQPAVLGLYDSFPMYDARAYSSLAKVHPYDLNLYQIGNNPLHRYQYDAVLNRPGLVTLHDLCIYNLLHSALIGQGRSDEFWREIAFCEGDSAAEKMRRDYLAGRASGYDLSLNRRIVTASQGVVVHSEYGLRDVTHYPEAPPAKLIPFGLFHLDDDEGQFGHLVRRIIGLPENAFVFSSFGNLHQVKRIPVIIRAFERVRALNPHAHLFLMGPPDARSVDVMHAIQDSSLAAHTRGIHFYLTYASYDLMLMAMQAVDVGINLRYPTAGETSGTLSMLLGMGKPTIVSDIGSFAEYPDDCCPKVPTPAQASESTEEDVLVQQMMRFIENSTHYREACAAAYIYGQGKSWSDAAQQYLKFIDQLVSGGTSKVD